METLRILPPRLLKHQGSYRTYEEWKLSIRRNWIQCLFVLTVPMRNGNFEPANVQHSDTEFLPYL